jgi:threonine aldolase
MWFNQVQTILGASLVTHDQTLRSFASDNYAGVHPEVLTAIASANDGHQSAYGYDDYTQALQQKMRDEFGQQAETFVVFNGTGANVLALTAMMPRWGAVICSNLAHIETDEGGAPERVSGLKLFNVQHVHGKLTPESIATQVYDIGFEHRAQPLVVSITQSTEVGTVYSVAEIKAIADYCHENKLLLHLDGARIWNAAAALGVTFKEMITDTGVDVVSFGGTKNGVIAAEAVVVINPEAVDGLIFLRKLSMQLMSKMRFASAQLLALLENGLGMRSAAHANKMASHLRHLLEAKMESGEIVGLRFTNPTDANAVFACLPKEAIAKIREQVHFYDWDLKTNEVRWMCAFDTTEADVERFVGIISETLKP